jgi:hypothetical protein
MSSEFEQQLGCYWSLAYAEGLNGGSHGDAANKILHRLREMHNGLTIPEGYVLVPVEPTPEMLIDGRDADIEWQGSDDDANGLSVIYKAMIAAARRGA